MISIPSLGLLRGKTHNDQNHARLVLTSCADTSHQQDYNCHGDSSYREVELNTSMLSHDDDELDREANEKEEVELQQSDENLKWISHCAYDKVGRL